MSTELLTRRMDLIHSVFANDNTQQCKLKMDTSYPARLSGIVVKVFKAVSDYNKYTATGTEVADTLEAFTIVNASDPEEIVCKIPHSKVLDFEGKKLKNKAYLNNDYVIAIIDINSANVNDSKMMLQVVSSTSKTPLKYLNYYCNEKNDNVVLGELMNILVDLYDYSSNINHESDEYKFSMTNGDRRNIFHHSKFYVNVIGKYGIDWSQTDFVYGNTNRSNRSSLMKISGTAQDTRTANISTSGDLKSEIVMNWDKCYIPKIKFDNNEKFAALFNAKLDHYDSDGNVIYYDYWTEENNAHFVDEDGNAYGNLFPRRLAFMSIEGALPINLTVKGMDLSTFGIGIYIETESEKKIKIQDCTFEGYCWGGWSNGVHPIEIDGNLTYGDITNNTGFFLAYRQLCYIAGTVCIDINAFNPTVLIDNCTFASNDDINAAVDNSSRNTRITNCNMENCIAQSNAFPLDYEYNPDYTYGFAERTFINPFDRNNINHYNANDILNPNNIEIPACQCLLNTVYWGENYWQLNGSEWEYRSSDYEGNNMGPYSGPCTSKVVFSGTTALSNFSDLTDYFNPVTTGTMIFQSMHVQSKYYYIGENSGAGTGQGIVKNRPILFMNNYKKIYDSETGRCNLVYKNLNFYINTTDSTLNNPIINTEGFNNEAAFQPNLFISDTIINSNSLLNVSGGNVFINNCDLSNTKENSWSYGNLPIILTNGTLNINSCNCLYDNRKAYFFNDYIYTNDNVLDHYGFIRVMPTLYEKAKTHTGYSTGNNDSYSLGDPSIRAMNHPVLNLSNSKLLMLPDITINSILKNGINDNSNKTYVYNFIPSISYGGVKYCGFSGSTNSAKRNASFITSCDANREGKTYFNPFTAPTINVDSCEFSIVNNFSTHDNSDFIAKGSTFDAKNDVLGNVVRIGSSFINNLNAETPVTTMPYGSQDNTGNIFSGTEAEWNTLLGPDSTAPTDASIQNYLNIVKLDITASSNPEISSAYLGFDLTMRDIEGSTSKKVRRIIRIYRVRTSDKTHLDSEGNIVYDWHKGDPFYNEGNDLIIEQYEIDSGAQNQYNYWNLLKKTYAHTYYDFAFKLATLAGEVSYTREQALTVQAEDIEDHIFVTPIYPSDLMNTGLYIDIPIISNCYNYSDSNKFTSMGTIAFDLENCIFNINNSQVGSVIDGKIRHSYASELLLRRSPRIAFKFDKNGIYKINNTKASAWASVVWCNLDGSYKKTYDESTADNKVYTNDFIDITSIDLMKSSCTIDNSTLINPNIFRLNSKMEDIKQLVETYDLPTNNRSDNDVTWKGAIYAGVGQEYFSETICNYNEMPIIFVANDISSEFSIFNSNIAGNETIVNTGNFKMVNSKYINNSNGLILFMGRNTYDQNCTLTLIGNDIKSTKDLINDKYVDKTKKKLYGTQILIEDCTKCGQSKYELNDQGKFISIRNNISAFILYSGLEKNIKDNRIIMRPNAFDKEYGVYDNVQVCVFNIYNTEKSLNPFIKDFMNIESNDISLLFGCPIIKTLELQNNEMVNNTDNKERILPDSNNISIIKTQLYMDNTTGDHQDKDEYDIKINNNKFTVPVVLENDCVYNYRLCNGFNNDNGYGDLIIPQRVLNKNLEIYNEAGEKIYDLNFEPSTSVTVPSEAITGDRILITDQLTLDSTETNGLKYILLNENNEEVEFTFKSNEITVNSQTKTFNSLKGYVSTNPAYTEYDEKTNYYYYDETTEKLRKETEEWTISGTDVSVARVTSIYNYTTKSPTTVTKSYTINTTTPIKYIDLDNDYAEVAISSRHILTADPSMLTKINRNSAASDNMKYHYLEHAGEIWKRTSDNTFTRLIRYARLSSSNETTGWYRYVIEEHIDTFTVVLDEQTLAVTTTTTPIQGTNDLSHTVVFDNFVKQFAEISEVEIGTESYYTLGVNGTSKILVNTDDSIIKFSMINFKTPILFVDDNGLKMDNRLVNSRNIILNINVESNRFDNATSISNMHSNIKLNNINTKILKSSVVLDIPINNRISGKLVNNALVEDNNTLKTNLNCINNTTSMNISSTPNFEINFSTAAAAIEAGQIRQKIQKYNNSEFGGNDQNFYNKSFYTKIFENGEFLNFGIGYTDYTDTRYSIKSLGVKDQNTDSLTNTSNYSIVVRPLVSKQTSQDKYGIMEMLYYHLLEMVNANYTESNVPVSNNYSNYNFSNDLINKVIRVRRLESQYSTQYRGCVNTKNNNFGCIKDPSNGLYGYNGPNIATSYTNKFECNTYNELLRILSDIISINKQS